jgi:hypothetical protein
MRKIDGAKGPGCGAQGGGEGPFGECATPRRGAARVAERLATLPLESPRPGSWLPWRSVTVAVAAVAALMMAVGASAQTPGASQVGNLAFDSVNGALRVDAVANGGGGGPAASFLDLNQLFNLMYDSTNDALKVNIVAGEPCVFTGAGSINCAPTAAAGSITLSPTGAGDAFARNLATAVNSVTFSATPTFDASLGNTQEITLSGNVTSSALANAAAGEKLNFVICQNATGGYTFAWPGQMHGAMTVGATASKCSAQSFIYDGTNAYALTPGVVNQ